jgi:hypothetical protein
MKSLGLGLLSVLSLVEEPLTMEAAGLSSSGRDDLS